MKSYFYRAITFFSLMYANGVYALTQDELKTQIIPPTGNNVLSTNTASENGEGFSDAIFLVLRDTIFGIIAIIAIGVFLFIGGRLIVARGNPEEFKKALTSFVYAVIGILVTAFALAIVRLIAGISV